MDYSQMIVSLLFVLCPGLLPAGRCRSPVARRRVGPALRGAAGSHPGSLPAGGERRRAPRGGRPEEAEGCGGRGCRRRCEGCVVAAGAELCRSLPQPPEPRWAPRRPPPPLLPPPRTAAPGAAPAPRCWTRSASTSATSTSSGSTPPSESVDRGGFGSCRALGSALVGKRWGAGGAGRGKLRTTIPPAEMEEEEGIVICTVSPIASPPARMFTGRKQAGFDHLL